MPHDVSCTGDLRPGMRRLDFVRSLVAAASLPPVAVETPRPDPAIDRLFARAKIVWRERVDPPFVQYALTESYETAIDRPVTHAWTATLRTADRRLAFARLPDPPRQDPATALAQDPPIRGNDSFGFVSPLRGAVVRAAANAPAAAPPRAARLAAPALATPPPAGLHEIARTEAFVRDYVMEDVGVETLGGELVTHLLLVPRREPLQFRLRDLWITVTGERIAQLATQGLFAEPPFDTARWLVRYEAIGGVPYVKRVFNVEDLAIAGQTVRFLSFACDGYTFPASVASGTFTS